MAVAAKEPSRRIHLAAIENENEHESKTEMIFRVLSVLTLIICPLLLCCCFRVVNNYQRAVLFRFGRVRPNSPAGPGLVWINFFIDHVIVIDMRTLTFDLPPQQILTKDSVTVTVDAIVYFHVLKPIYCVLNVQNNSDSTELITIAILRTILGQHTLTEILQNRERIGAETRQEIDKVTSEWGIEIERVEIKDIQLPLQLQKAMAAEAEGTRIAKAKLIEAEGEIKTAMHLREASDVIMENPQIMLKRKYQHLKIMKEEVRMSASADNAVKIDVMRKESLNNDNVTPVRQCTYREGSTFMERLLVLIAYTLVVILLPISLLYVFFVVTQFQRAVIMRNGKLRKKLIYGPGIVFILPCVDIVKITDLRIISYAIDPQEALTSDSLTVSVDAVVYYQVNDPVPAVMNVEDYRMATQYIGATTLRNAIGTRRLIELLTNRRSVSTQVHEQMKILTSNWGVRVLLVEIKDIRLPLQLQKAMAAEAESSRLANAKIIVAQAEIESTKSLQKATKLLLENPWGMQLRYLQSLHMISSDQIHTVVVPCSLDSLKTLFK